MQEEKLHARLIALCMACIFRIISSTADCFKRILNSIHTKGKHSNAARESSKMTSFLVFHNNSVANISFPAVGLMIFTFLLLCSYQFMLIEWMRACWQHEGLICVWRKRLVIFLIWFSFCRSIWITMLILVFLYVPSNLNLLNFLLFTL